MSFEQIKELNPLLEQIDALQKHVNSLKAAHSDAYARIMENWAIESTYNSNSIEGSTLSLGDTALLYAGAQVDAPANDIRQAEGGFAALRFLRKELDAEALFSETLIKRAHELAYAEASDPATRGIYRTVEVEISGTDFEPAPSIYVSERMKSLVASINGSRKHAAITSALFHLEFESIHPFVNANGRTGRLMSSFLLMKSGYEPVNIQAESRPRYIIALQAFSLEDDPYPFAAFFCASLLERLEKIESMLEPSKCAPLVPRVSGIGDFLSMEAEKPAASIEGNGRIEQVELTDTPQVPHKLTPQVARLIKTMGEAEYSSPELMEMLHLRDRKNFQAVYLTPALQAGLVERTVPDKPHSSKQKYRKVRK